MNPIASLFKFLRTAVARKPLACALIFVAIGLGITFSTKEMRLQMTLRPKIERELGFRFVTPYIKVRDRGFSTEVISFGWLKTGGILWRAGVRGDDILLDKRSIGTICCKWHAARGQLVTFQVVSFGNGQPLDERPNRTVKFVMPEK